MKHISLYRKYRPLTWEQIIGQNHIVRTIKNQICSSSISHAYLFTGSRGTGKTSSAKIFARAVNCLNPLNGSPCNKCENCLSILNETSFDVLELDAASNNSVNDIRALIENINIPPMNGKYKVYIVDEVHMLSQQAFNAFLKTLEEPPEYVIFILATTEAHKLPATILSRCMQFDFRLIPVDELTEIITTIFDKENYKYEIEACRQIAIHGEGSARDSLSIADMCMAYAPQKLIYNDVLEVLGGSDFETLYTIAEAMLNSNIARLLEYTDLIYRRGKGISTLNKELANFFKDLITIKNVASYKPFSEEQNKIALALANEHDNYRISRILELVASIESILRYSAQPKILFEANLIKATQLITEPNIEALNSRIKAIENQITSFSEDNIEYFKKFLNNKNIVQSVNLNKFDDTATKNTKTNMNIEDAKDSQKQDYKDIDIKGTDQTTNNNLHAITNLSIEKNEESIDLTTDEDSFGIPIMKDKKHSNKVFLPFDEDKNLEQNKSNEENESILNLPFETNEIVEETKPIKDDGSKIELPNNNEIIEGINSNNKSDLEVKLAVDKNNKTTKISKTTEKQSKEYNNIELKNDISVDKNIDSQKTNDRMKGEILPFETEKMTKNEHLEKKIYDMLLKEAEESFPIIQPYLRLAESYELNNGYFILKFLPVNTQAVSMLEYDNLKQQFNDSINKISPGTKLSAEILPVDNIKKITKSEIEEVKKLIGPNIIIK